MSIDGHRTKAIQPLDEKYSIDRVKVGKFTKLAEEVVESVFFKIEEKEITIEEYQKMQPEGLMIQGGKGKSTSLAG